MQKGIFYLLLVVIVVLVIIIFALLIFYGKQRHGQRTAVKMVKKVNDDYQNLKIICNEMAITNGNLSEKYELLKESKEKVEKLAYTDYLTQLPNYIALVELLNSVLMTLRSGEIVAIMDIDIDDFKSVNDLLGYSYGDQMLIDIANRLIDVLDDNDYLARMNGDEFAVLSQNFTDFTEIEEKISKIHKIFTYPYSIANKEIFLTVSIGIVIVPRDGKTTQVILKNMNSALMEAKLTKKNMYVHFDESMNQKLNEKIEMQSDLRKAIDDNQFLIQYQPQVLLENDQIYGFQAIIYWNHPIKGQIEYSEFFMIAEETGLISQILKIIVLEVCNQIKRWEDIGIRDFKISIPLSNRQFIDCDLVLVMESILAQTKIDANIIILEISENIAIGDLGYTIEKIERLKELGFIICLIDFSIQYATMNYLKILPADYLRVNKHFIESILNNNDKRINAIIMHVIQNLKLIVLIDGLEESEMEEFRKQIPNDKILQYFTKKPIAALQAEALLTKNY